ncbi:hypothetical protein [Streptomyces sp. NPDC059010]|uniref:hypothetical protein n=1 Tax=Streptomyces sp. NPDC059010 TaxID=3346695 RepID=UPI0036B25E46
MTRRYDEEGGGAERLDGPEGRLDGPEFGPDDPLAVILRLPSGYLAPPPGHYDAIRRRASRRRLLRTAAGVGATCAVAALIAVPLYLARPDGTPTPPLAPPPASGRTTPAPTPTPSEPSPTPTPRESTGGSASPTRTVPPESAGPSYGSPATPAPSSTPTATPTAEPTAVPTTGRVEPSDGGATSSEAAPAPETGAARR